MDRDGIFDGLYARLEGMYMLMNFAGSVGKLMQETGLYKILGSAFGSVQKIMSAKLYPQNVRALRMVAEVFLAKHINAQDTHQDLENFLQSVSEKSPTPKQFDKSLRVSSHWKVSCQQNNPYHKKYSDVGMKRNHWSDECACLLRVRLQSQLNCI